MSLLKQIHAEWGKALEQDSVTSDGRAGVTLARIPGDASTRRYYRVEHGGASFILMKLDPFVAEGDRLSFLTVQRHLAGCAIDVPKVIEFDALAGMILLEDLGDATLLHRLKTVTDADTERQIYQKVIDQLVEMQVRAGPEKASQKIASFDLQFDFDKLYWEVNFTIEHFYEKHLKRSIGTSERKVLEQGFSEICRTLAQQPFVFTHRDYHCRNIMVVGDRLVMIDFQDARMGPAQYDLVSLLKDSYYQLEERQISSLVDYYIARWEARSGINVQREEFLRIFDLMQVQRNFKAIGSFASFQNLRGNATYLKYVGNTFENIRRTLLKHPRYSELREVLFHYYYF